MLTDNQSGVNHNPPEAEPIIRELLKPENRDLLFAVMQQDSGDEAEQSFMFGFTYAKPTDFDTFAGWTHIIDTELAPALDMQPDYRSMSERYDEYLASIEQHNDRVLLNKEQTDRFETLVNQFDNGWSGAYYGVLMRHVQHRLRQMFNN